MNKLVYFFTIGCQMNTYDFNQIKSILNKNGFKKTDDFENSDLIVLNTCSIRKKSEQKVFSFLGKIANLKKIFPSLIIAVGGCVSQQYGAYILKRMPFIDLIFGTDSIYRLPSLLFRIIHLKCRIVDINISSVRTYNNFSLPENIYSRDISSFVTIMRGCNNYCSYCVVPYVRGKEFSLKPERIVSEIKNLVKLGTKEVVLLGQNVNSYGNDYENDNKMYSFVNLLKKINVIKGLKRIRFITSNPNDLSDSLILSFSQIDKLCKHIHLPVQSGDNVVLKRMNRKYTIEGYIDKIIKLRKICPEISITSDFIVGFPGESDLQFKSTLDLIKKIRFDGSFSFMYSDRPNVVASKFINKINYKIKRNRLQKLLKLQNLITTSINFSFIGFIEKVLVENFLKTDKYMFNEKNINRNNNIDYIVSKLYWFGRTSGNRVVYFLSEKKINPKKIIGREVKVMIYKANSHSLYGKLL